MADLISTYRQIRLIGTVPSSPLETPWARLDLLAVRRGIPRSETLGTWQARVSLDTDVESYAADLIRAWVLGECRMM